MDAFEVFFQRNGVDRAFRKDFVADSCEQRRSFMRAVLTDRSYNMFGDIQTLWTRRGHCEILNKVVDVADTDWLFAGFPCRDVSSANNFAVDTLSDSGTTGGCLWSILRFLEHYPSVSVWIGENVRGLKRHIHVMQLELYQRGFILLHIELSPSQLGMPQDRPRIWWAAVRRESLAISSRDAHAIFHDCIAAAKQSSKDASASYVEYLNDDLPSVQNLSASAACHNPNRALQYHARVSTLAHAPKEDGAAPRGTGWIQRHEELGFDDKEPLALAPGQVATGSPMCFERFPTLKMLTLRELCYLMSVCPALPEQHSRLIECSQSAGRNAPRSHGSFGTIIPKGKVVETVSGRLVTGCEKLHVQGIPLPSDIATQFCGWPFNRVGRQFLLHDLLRNGRHGCHGRCRCRTVRRASARQRRDLIFVYGSCADSCHGQCVQRCGRQRCATGKAPAQRQRCLQFAAVTCVGHNRQVTRIQCTRRQNAVELCGNERIPKRGMPSKRRA
jgi:site-specific DNA-cytosine methylase